MDGNYSEDVLEMVKVMEPRTSTMFLKLDEKSKSDHVVGFQQSGNVPSRNDLTNYTKSDRLPPTYTLKAPVRPSIRVTGITGKKMNEAGVTAQECLEWLIQLATDNSPSEKTRELIAQLYSTCYEEVK